MVWIKVAVIVVFILAGMQLHRHRELASLPAGEHRQGRRVRRGAACCGARRSSSSRTSASMRHRPRRARRAIRSATCRSAFSARWSSRRCSTSRWRAVMTGMVPYQQLGVDAPVAVALDAHPQLRWLGALVKVGAIAGMTSVILMSMLGQPRIFLAMADDGLLPPGMSKVHPKYRTPHVATVITTVAGRGDRRPVPAQHSRRADLDGHPAGVHRRCASACWSCATRGRICRGRSACRWRRSPACSAR